MTKNMYLIFDGKALIYNAPFLMINDQVAVRAAQDIINDPNSEIARNPHDFTMFRIGQYDDNTGQIDLEATHKVICRFHELPKNIPHVLDQEENDKQDRANRLWSDDEIAAANKRDEEQLEFDAEAQRPASFAKIGEK